MSRRSDWRPPQYDVKIVAGRRVVVFKDRDDNNDAGHMQRKQSNNNNKTNNSQVQVKPKEQQGGQRRRNDESPRVPAQIRSGWLVGSSHSAEDLRRSERREEDTRDKHNNGQRHRDTSEPRRSRRRHASRPKPWAAAFTSDSSATSSGASSSSSSSSNDTHTRRRRHPSKRRSQSRKKVFPKSGPVPLNETYTVGKDGRRVFPRLPPLTPSSRGPPPPTSAILASDSEMASALDGVSERGLEVLLRDCRSKDRDRDRVLTDRYFRDIVLKHQLSIVPVLDGLQTRFADKSSPGMTNYEDLVQYLLQLKASRARDGRLRAEAEASEAKQHDFHAKMEARRARLATAEAENSNSNRSSSSLTGVDGATAALVSDVVRRSPHLDMAKLESALRAKDVYGVDQVSRQHVEQAANAARMDALDRPTLSAWLSAADTSNGKGIYNISKLMAVVQTSLSLAAGNARGSNSGGAAKKTVTKSASAPLPLNTMVPQTPPWEERKPLRRLDPVGSLSNAKPVQTSKTQRDLNELKRALFASYQEVPGYLSPRDVEYLCKTYNKVYQMNMSDSVVHDAIASSTEQRGLVTLGLFYKNLESALSSKNSLKNTSRFY